MRGALRREWQVFLLAVQFLTRLPVPASLPFSEARMVAAVKYYPAVGLVVGGLGGLALWAAAGLWPLPVAVLVSIAATVLATGAFHEDGLADTADGLGGGQSRDQALEIMRDSRIGTYGAAALGLVLALKALALIALGAPAAALALPLGHALGRLAAVQVIATAPYARETGAKFAAPSVSRQGLCIAWGTALAAVLALGGVLGWGVLAGAAVGALAAWEMRRRILRRLAGYTGDGLGAVQQLAELGFYLGLLAWA